MEIKQKPVPNNESLVAPVGRDAVGFHSSLGNYVEVICVFAIAAAVSSTNLAQPPIYDEVYHILSARSWLSEGTFRIAEGTYDRAWVFTTIVAWFSALFGDSLGAFRLPSVIAGSCLVAAVFLWVRDFGGRTAAWIAAMGFCFYPDHILASHHIRFYSLHALAFWLFATSMFSLSTAKTTASKKLIISIVAFVTFLLALHLQFTTLIGVMAILVWFFSVLLIKANKVIPRVSDKVVFVALTIGGAIALLVAWDRLPFLKEVLEHYRAVTEWNVSQQNSFYFYIVYFISEYPTFFTLLPVASLLAINRYPGPLLFSSIIFFSSFVFISFGGMKAPRYMYFITPYFFIIWGVALAELLHPMRARLKALIGSVINSLGREAAPTRGVQSVGASISFLVVAFVLVTNPAFAHALRDILRQESHDLNWSAASSTLRPFLNDVDVVIVSDPKLYALYFLGRSDVFIGSGDHKVKEFEVDRRTGKPVISKVSSLVRLMKCYSSGLIIVEGKKWRKTPYVNEELADYIVRNTTRVPMQDKWGIEAFVWQQLKHGGPKSGF